jgi:hypothetical protein
MAAAKPVVPGCTCYTMAESGAMVLMDAPLEAMVAASTMVLLTS